MIKYDFLLQIGLMRNGQLLAEESPTDLMIKHNCSNLEQAFLELSKKQHKFRTEKEALEYVSIFLITITTTMSIQCADVVFFLSCNFSIFLRIIGI